MKQISQLIREIIPVILGILIALVINNWNEDRKDQKYLTQIFSSIEQELVESNADIKRIIPKQQRLVDSLDIYLGDETVSVVDLMRMVNGLHAPAIKTNTWKAIANSRIELIEYEKLSALSDIEEKKENLKKRLDAVSDFVYNNFRTTNTEKKETLKLLTLDVIYAEKDFHAKIEAFLNQ